MRGMQHCWTHPNWVRWWTWCHMSLPHSLLAPPRNTMSAHHDHQWLAMRIHHHDRGMVMTTHKCPQAPNTMIDEQQRWPTGHKDPPPWLTSTHEQPWGTTPTIDEWPRGETRAEGDPQGMWQNESAFWSPLAHPSIHAQINADNPQKPTSDEDRPLQPPTNNDCPPRQDMGMTTHKKRGAPIPHTHEQSLCTPSTCTFENPCPWTYIHITTKSPSYITCKICRILLFCGPWPLQGPV